MHSSSPDSSPLAPGLEQLLAWVHPTDTCRGLFFNGLLDAVRGLGDESLEARCLAVAGGRPFADVLSYPVADFLRPLFLAAEVLGPERGGADAVIRQFGRRSTEDFLGSTLGKTMLALSGRQPARLLSTIPNGCRASVSYGERFVELLGPGRGRLMVRRDYLPLPYVEGVILSTLELSTAQDIQVRAQRRAPLDVDFDVSWS